MSRLESPDMQLVELLRRSDGPSDEDMRRVRDAIGVHLAVGAAASTVLLASTHTSWAARLGSLGTWGKGILVVTSLIGASVGVALVAKPEALLFDSPRLPEAATRPAAMRTTGTRQTTTASEQSGTIAESSNHPAFGAAETDTKETDAKVRSGTSKATARATSSTLEAELVLLGRAQSALKGGQPGEALAALDEHSRRFPSGVLALERSGVRTVALCQSGRLAEGRTAAKNYLRLVPNSVLSKRIRVACQLADE